MPSIFDFLLNRQAAGPTLPGMAPVMPQASSNDPRVPSILDDSPSARDTLMGLSQGLLAAGAPSLMPMDFGSALGKGLTGALGANDEDKRLKRALVTSQVQKAQSDIANDKAWQDMFKTPAASETSPVSPVTPPVGAPTPLGPIAGGGGPSNPTNPGNLADGKGGFQTFKSPEEGVAAAIKLAQEFPKRYNGGQPMTLAQVEAHWAPPDDGKDPMTRGNRQGVWSGNVARGMGIDPNTPIDFSNPAMGLAFAQAVHKAEHPPGRGYAPDVYQRGSSLVYGLPAFSTPGAATPTQAMLPPPSAVPAGVPAAAPGVPGPIPQPPIQLASAPTGAAPGMPPQGDALPATGPQMAQAAPAAPPAKTLPEVIQSLPPAVRQMMGAMPRKDALPLLLKYADPETHVAIDTTTGAVVFAPKNDRSGRYQPVDAMKLDIDKQRVETERRQAAAREEANRIRGANEPLNADGTPNPNYVPQQAALEAAKEKERRDAETRQLTDPNYQGGKAAVTGATETAKRQSETGQLVDPNYIGGRAGVTGAEAGAKVGPALLQHQGELVIKDSQGAQVAADHSRVGIANLSRLGALLEQVNTGKFQGTVQELKASAKAAGVDLDALGVGDNVGVAQAAKALTGQLALGLRDPSGGAGMPGAMSDKDREFLVAMVPAITNDPNGNKLMLEWQKKIYQRQIEVAKIVNDYGRSPEFLKDPTGVYAKVREYADKNPLFDPEKDAPKAPAAGGSLAVPPMNAIDAEIARRKKAGAK